MCLHIVIVVVLLRLLPFAAIVCFVCSPVAQDEKIPGELH